MFPLNANEPYIKETGERSTLGAMIGSGGGGGGGSTIYTGSTVPDAQLGTEGDIYLYMPSAIQQTFVLTITKALRGDNEQNYAGAQEIQLFFTDGETTKNIIEFPNFFCSANGGNINYAFDGNTAGSYWEKSGLAAIVTFGADIPVGWTVDKLVVWQRNDPSYADVWKTFDLRTGNITIIDEKNLTQSDWAGIGHGTEFDPINTDLPSISSVFYKVKRDDVVHWIY